MKRRADGFALILVIWALVLLATVASGFAAAVRHETRSAGDLASLARSEAIAAAAVRLAALALASTDPDIRWQADAQLREIPWPDARVGVRVRSENARIDLNRAPRELLVGLFAHRLPQADPEQLADAVIDWRDANDDPEPHGAEELAYRRAGYGYAPPNQPFHSVNELSQVIGFSDDGVRTLVPYLTVHSRWARISVASAEADVLMAIPGLEPTDVEAFIAQRDAALATGEPIDFGPLGGAQKYIETGGRSKTYALEIIVRLEDGTPRQERVVIQLDPRRGFNTLARDMLAALPEGSETP